MIGWWVTIALLGIVWLVILILQFRAIPLVPVIRPDGRQPHEHPLVSILVPMRNESDNVAGCLTSLLAQEYPDFEIIVIDDRSTDDTAARVEALVQQHPRLRLVRGAEPPSGWMGKCYALHQGSDQGQPQGQWLLFVDADTRHHPQALAAVMTYALEQQVDMLSVIPFLECHSFWERVVQPAVGGLIGVFYPPDKVNRTHRPIPFANGQFLLVRREAYQSLGGHQAVAGKVLEDVELAKVFVAHGLRNRIVFAHELVTTRMYTHLSALIQGWTKNMYLLLGQRMQRVLLSACMALLLSSLPLVVGFLGLLSILGHPGFFEPRLAVAALGLYGWVIFCQATIRAQNRWYPWYAPFAPIGNAILVWIVMRSSFLHRRRQGVSWKDRQIIDR